MRQPNDNNDRTDLASSLVQPFAAMTGNQRLLHVEHRHGARGLKDPNKWEAWHKAAHQAELSHTHGGEPKSPGSDPPGDPIDAGQGVRPGAVRPQGVPATRFQAPEPTEAQKRAAWSCDLRNPAFVNDSPGTAVITDERDWDYGDGFEMV
jgi:hypothetical protein